DTSRPPWRQSKTPAALAVALERAVADSHQGWIGQRVFDGLTNKRRNESLSLRIHYAPGVVAGLTKRVAATGRRDPVDASVDPSASGLSVKGSKRGRALNETALKQKLAAAITSARRAPSIAWTAPPG